MEKETKRELALLFRTSRLSYSDSDTYRFLASAVCIEDGEHVRNLSSDFLSGKLHQYNDLTASCFYDAKDLTENRHYFSINFYDPHRVDLRTAKSMVKVLSAIDHKLDADYASLGPVESFGAYVARVALAIGAKKIIFQRGECNSSSYDDCDWYFCPVGQAVTLINRKIRETVLPATQEQLAA